MKVENLLSCFAGTYFKPLFKTTFSESLKVAVLTLKMPLSFKRISFFLVRPQPLHPRLRLCFWCIRSVPCENPQNMRAQGGSDYSCMEICCIDNSRLCPYNHIVIDMDPFPLSGEKTCYVWILVFSEVAVDNIGDHYDYKHLARWFISNMFRRMDPFSSITSTASPSTTLSLRLGPAGFGGAGITIGWSPTGLLRSVRTTSCDRERCRWRGVWSQVVG